MADLGGAPAAQASAEVDAPSISDPPPSNKQPPMNPELTVDTTQSTSDDPVGPDEPELTATTAFEQIADEKGSAALQELKDEVATLQSINKDLNASNSELLKTQNILQSQKEEELRRSMALLTEQMASKDLQNSNLLKEVVRRNEAIRSCGEEIVKLRKESSNLALQNKRLSGELAGIRANEEREMERITSLLRDEVATPSSIPEPIMQQMRILAQNFGKQTDQLNRTTEELEKANETLVKYREKDEAYQDGQKVLAKQAKQLGKMEKMEVKLGAYKSTVAMQEKVIGKLEGVIENKIREEARRGPAAWAKAEIEDKKRREELEGEMETMAAVVEDLKSGKEAAESGNAELSRDLDLAQQTLLTVERAHSELLSQPRGPDPELTEKLQISELKLQAVMETMDTNTKNAQREISELKVQLFEYEMGDAGSLGDELSSVLGGMSRNTSLGSLPSLAAR